VEDDPLLTTQTLDGDDLATRLASDTLAPPVRAQLRLIVVAGDDVGRSVPIGLEDIVIGRGSDADLQLSGTEISRHHARIVWRGDKHVIADLKSRNGTCLNGMKLAGEHPLRIGDRIQIGASTTLLFTEHDELEDRAIRLQKLESLAALAGGLVHDFKNTLCAIIGNAEFVATEMAEAKDVPEDWASGVRDIRNAAQAGLALAERLLYFARRQERRERARIDVAQMIDEAVALVRRPFETQHKIQIRVETRAGLEVRGVRDELHQALLNLLFNARDAMPDGGTLTISSVARQFNRAEAAERHLSFSGAYAEIAVTDTGIGMDAATQARIFEPFFTTKGGTNGTGLGLATVYGVIRNHGGNPFVESAPGRGTTFRLLLPLAPEG
jgi:signal transduction histidine kinase